MFALFFTELNVWGWCPGNAFLGVLLGESNIQPVWESEQRGKVKPYSSFTYLVFLVLNKHSLWAVTENKTHTRTHRLSLGRLKVTKWKKSHIRKMFKHLYSNTIIRTSVNVWPTPLGVTGAFVCQTKGRVPPRSSLSFLVKWDQNWLIRRVVVVN